MQPANYISGLTPLRGIAALLVILLHYQIFIAKLHPEGQTHAIEKLYLMVDLFFVLSGFIMYHVYGKLFKSGIRKGSYFKFMKARFARIYPLHLFSFLFALAVSLIYVFSNTPMGNIFSSFLDYSAVPSQLLLTQAMGTHHEATWNTPSWSISVEWWAYVLFPVFLLAFVRTKQWSRYVFGALILGGYLYITYYAEPLFWATRWEMMGIPKEVPYPIHTIDVITGHSAFLRCLCGFVTGMIFYEGFQKNWGSTVLGKGISFVGLWVLLFALWHFDALPDLLSPLFFGLMILSAAYNNGRLRSTLNTKVFQFLGDISYSLYLMHMPLLFLYIALRKAMIPNDPRQGFLGYNFTLTEAWLGFFLFLAITLALASFTYYYIEKPARLFLNRPKKALAEVQVVPARTAEASLQD